MTLDLNRLEALYAKTTKASEPWEADSFYGYSTVRAGVVDVSAPDAGMKPADAEFCAEVHTAFPALVAEIRRLSRRAEALEASLHSREPWKDAWVPLNEEEETRFIARWNDLKAQYARLTR